MIEGYYISYSKTCTFNPCSTFYTSLYHAKKQSTKELSKDSSFLQFCKCNIFIDESDIFDLTRNFHRNVLKAYLPENIILDDDYYTKEDIMEYLDEEMYPPWDLLYYDFMLNTIKAAGYKGHVTKSVDGFTYLIFSNDEKISVEETYTFTKTNE